MGQSEVNTFREAMENTEQDKGCIEFLTKKSGNNRKWLIRKKMKMWQWVALRVYLQHRRGCEGYERFRKKIGEQVTVASRVCDTVCGKIRIEDERSFCKRVHTIYEHTVGLSISLVKHNGILKCADTPSNYSFYNRDTLGL